MLLLSATEGVRKIKKSEDNYYQTYEPRHQKIINDPSMNERRLT
jgi:hypothetical protein